MIAVNDLRTDISYDPSTGLMKWKRQRSNAIKVGQPCGHTKPSGYVYIKLSGRLIGAHRVAWAIHYGVWPSECIDHINGNPSDNRIANLRLATRNQNAWNTSVRQDNKTGFKGVTKRTYGRFRAKINAFGETHNLGTFDSADEAHSAYCAAAKRLHGEFANLGPRDVPGCRIKQGRRVDIK